MLVFFEDKDCEALYEVVASKVFDGVSTKVVCLTGKDSVLAHSELPDRQQHARRLYVLDKDFDDLLGKLVARNNLVYLTRYSIENFLLEEDALIEIVVEEFPNLDRQAIVQSLDLPTYFSSVKKSLLPLVRAFVAIQKYSLGLENAALSIQTFCEPGALHVPCVTRVNAYEDSVIKLLIERGNVADAAEAKLRLTEIVADSDVLLHVPGKMILSLAYHYLGRKLKVSSIRFQSLAYRLAKNCEFDSLSFLADKAALLAPLAH